MNKVVTIDGFATAINEVFEEYTQLTQEQIDKAAASTARKLAKDISARASSTFGGTGRYAASWRSKEDKEKSTRLNKAYVVYADEPGRFLSHLLEKGHAKRGGGRVAGRPHIAPAAEAAKDTLIQEIEKQLR